MRGTNSDNVRSSERPPGPYASAPAKVFNISGHNYGQVGDNNQQQLHVQTFCDPIAGIDQSQASTEAKAEAKGLLQRFFENPTVTAVAGNLAQGVVGVLKPPGT